MMFHKFLKLAAPAFGVAMASALSGCNTDVEIDGMKGVPLADLDLSGDPPSSLVLAAPVQVNLKTGKTLKIIPEGDGDVIDRLRFTNADGRLGIGMESGNWSSDGETIINVTMPAPKSVTVAGSGSVQAQTLKSKAKANLLGSGTLAIQSLKAERLDVNIMASGSIEAAGHADQLDLNIMGSGDVKMAELSAEKAQVKVMGSGSARFASDGTVKAKIMGSGSVHVIGSATCEVSSMGSGTVKCESAPKPAKTAAKSKKKKAAGKTKPSGKDDA